MYYKESFDLMTCKERKINALFNELLSREDSDIHSLFESFMYKYECGDEEFDMDDLSSELSAILAQYGVLRNKIIDYYYPGSEKKSYADVYGSDDE